MKVILNALPPARIDTPSAALSVLQAFLVHNGIETAIVYWNILLDRLLPPFQRDTDATHFELLPYIYMICGEYKDDIARSRCNAVMKAQLPVYDILNDNSDYLGKTKGIMDNIVAAEFARYPDKTPMLFGISCKYEQWIAGIVLGKYIKAAYPDSRIVIGGLSNRDKAESIMKICNDFDFAIWGEGEYPLLELCKAMENRTDDPYSVPRLVYRKDGVLHSSNTGPGRFFDLNSEIFPDHDDYFRYLMASEKKNIPVILPIESSRGCTWNSCRFCVYAEGYVSRKKDPGVLKEEISRLIRKYGTRYFAFMDNDIAANDHERLEMILDDLISIRQEKDIQFIAEIIPKNIKPDIMKKFVRAGLNRVHFGYESLSDRLLKKMRKKTNFSDNIFFVKFAHKYRIKLPSANIICGTVGEEDLDILECVDNLHFLRFYFDKNLFLHNMIPLRVARHSDFYDMIPKERLAKWDDNIIFSLLPGKMIEGIDRFSLFDFSAKPAFLWDLFAKLNKFYYDHVYSYSISFEDGAIVYREFFDGEPVAGFILDSLEYGILQKTDSGVIGLDELVGDLKTDKEPVANDKQVQIALNRLKERHLVYFDDDNLGSIISVIDTDQVL